MLKLPAIRWPALALLAMAINFASALALPHSSAAHAQAGFPSSCSSTPSPSTYKCREIHRGSEWIYLASVPAPPFNLGPFKSVGEAVSAAAQTFLPAGGSACSSTPTTFITDAVAPSYNYGVDYRHQHEAHFDVVYSNNSVPACTITTDAMASIDQRRSVDCKLEGELDGAWAVYTDPGTSHTFCRSPWTDVQNRPCETCKGNPVDFLSGTKFQREKLYRGSGQFPLDLTIEYDSRFARVNGAHLAADNREHRNPVGIGWFGRYFQSLQITSNAGVIQEVDARRGTNRNLFFRQTSGVFVPDGDSVERLTRLVDGSGNTTGWELRTADDSVESYDATGRMLSLRNRQGLTHTLSYVGASTIPAAVTDSYGNALSFTYDTSAFPRLQSVTLPDGNQVAFGYSTGEKLTTITFPDTRVRTFWYEDTTYGSGNLLTGVTDESAVRYSTWGYDADGKATSSTHAAGADSYTFAYIWDGSRTVIDPLGKSRTYTSSVVWGARRLAGSNTVCPGCGEDKARTFDANGNIASRLDFNDSRACYAYDLTRNLETVRIEGFASTVANCPANLASYTPAGGTRERKITMTWHPSFRIPTSIVEANRTTTFTHDTSGNVLTRTVTDTSVVPNVSRTWTYTYNSFGQVLTEDGPRTDVSDVTTFTYYTCTTGFQCGQLNTISTALSHVTTYNSYNAHGQPTQVTDANGLVTSLAYDLRQRLTDRCKGATLPGCSGGELTHLDYWPTGLLKKVTNPDASYIEYTFDAAHRLTQINDGALNKIVYTLDAMGNRTAENTYDPSLFLKRTHTRVFNTLNQLWKDVNAAGTVNVTTVFGYDNNNNQTTVNAPLSRNSTSLYDELNRIKQITDPNSGNTLFGYDANDNLTSVTDPRTLVTNYTYTGFGDLKTQTSPDTALTTNTYDSGGNLKTSTDARSAITTYTYDVLNRVATAAFKIGATTDQTITYTYDAGTNGKGHLTGASDANHSLSWTYDAKGRVTGKGQVVTGLTAAQSIGYGYNAAGQLASMVLPSGKTIAYGYNSNGQVTSVTLNGSPNVTILSNVTYDPFGPITGWTWGNSTTASRTFDTDGKLTQVTSSGQRTFGYDDAFRITAANDVATPANSWTLGYDILDRLNAATKPSTTIGYTYDADGNRLTQSGTSASTYTIPGTSNKLSSVTGVLARSYTYDAVGNALTTGVTTHTYNNRGRMKTGKLNAASPTTYIYNALGQRIKKSGGPQVDTVFMYDEAGHLIGEYSISAGAAVRVQETVWIGDIPIATLRTNGANVDVFYVHTDQLNTPRKITSTANVLRWRWDPTPFGEGAPSEPAGAFKYNLRFPGQYFDVETSINYNYFRDYDPAAGRYVESDPIGIRGGLNSFSYADANPASSADAFGLCPGDRKKCVEDFLRDHYGDFLTDNVIDGFSVQSYIPTSEHFGEAIRTSLESIGLKGLVALTIGGAGSYYAHKATRIMTSPMRPGPFGLQIRAAQAARAARIGTVMSNIAKAAARAVAVVGAGVTGFSSTATWLANQECKDLDL